MSDVEMTVFATLSDLAKLVTSDRGLYVRWSSGPLPDLASVSSRDDLTGVQLPGLSANSLDVADWWGDRPVHVWVARRLYDYSHLPHLRGARTRPWVLRGVETGRGPDNEPLVNDVVPLGWIEPSVIEEANEVINSQPGSWGPVCRESTL
ncbi:DUF6098 family protein [Streptomyces globisporus]|uniref:DUF6098 family protein n=1 Tax=Streptomyces globisporus TaxID=1908 RepID=UPI0033E27BD6